jgi:hypothetical protein
MCILGLIAKPCRAIAIYDNGAPLSSTDPTTVTGWEMTHYIQANNFFLANPSRFESLVFWDLEQPGYFAGSIVWQIYSDNGDGTPGTLIVNGTSRNLTHSGTGFTAFGNFSENITRFELGPLSLPTGSYWLALHNGDLSNGATGTVQDWNFYWEATRNITAALPLKKIAPYDGSWFSLTNPKDAEFQISGVASPGMPIVTIDGAVAEISFASTAGFNYRVEYKDGLVNAGWTSLPGAENVTGNGNVIRLTDGDFGTLVHRFYRVTLPYNGIGIPVISDFGSASGLPQISFTTAAGYFYQVQYRNDLSDLSWAPLGGVETIVGTGGIISLSDSDPNLGAYPRRFYRAVLR